MYEFTTFFLRRQEPVPVQVLACDYAIIPLDFQGNAAPVPNFRLSSYQTILLGFVGMILIGAILLYLPISTTSGRFNDPVDAFFTAASAVCVTGLVVVETGHFYNLFGQIVILILIQLGGLGYMAVVAIFSLILGRKMLFTERLTLSQGFNLTTVGGIFRFVRGVVVFTLVSEAAGALLLALFFSSDYSFGRSLYLGVFHSVSAFCNAGFGLFSDNLAGYVSSPAVLLTIAFLIIAGGLGYVVHLELFEQKLGKHFSLHSQTVLVTTAFLLLGGTLMVLGMEWANPATMGNLPWPLKLLNAFFSSVTPRTAGFNSLDYGAMRPVTLFFTVILMFIGASPGGTGGGIKTTTAAIVLTAVLSTIRGIPHTRLLNRYVTADSIIRALSLFMTALFALVVVSLIILAIEKFSMIQVIFESTSAFGTVGLSMGITPDLSQISKLVLSAMMILGRVGPITIGLAFFARRPAPPVMYPEEPVLIG